MQIDEAKMELSISFARPFMQIHRNISSLPPFRNVVITIGTFDGVHIGHRQIIKLILDEKRLINGETVIITFDPHPRQLLGGTTTAVQLLNTLEEKEKLLREAGIDHLVVVPFTPAFATLSAEQYIREFLAETFHPHTIIIGYDHRFGKDRLGDFRLLEAMATECSYTVKEIPALVLEKTTISSTRIRNALLKGDIKTANEYLGYSYSFSGIVIKGNQLGRNIGFPTANIECDESVKLSPANGVYAVEIMIDLETTSYKGMMNIGVRPTVAGTRRVQEVHLFNFDKDIYGATITVKFRERMRDEVKFSGLEALKRQLEADRLQALAFFG